MPRELPNRPDLDMVRQLRGELLAHTTGEDLILQSGTIRVSNVPVFQDREGQLCQAVRLRYTPASVAGVVVRISAAGYRIDEVGLAGDVEESAFLFIPEVHAETVFEVEAESAGQSASVDFAVVPQRKWTIHLVHQSHYDIGYTDPQVVVLASQLAYIDDALELATVTDDWPDESQFRWTIEANWPLRHWLRNRSSSASAELVRRINEGRIEVNALPFSMHTEAYSFDELARQLAFAQKLRDDLGIRITTAMQTDVPGATIGLSTLLTDAGIEFLAVAHNYAGRSIPHLLDGQELTRPFRWQAPDGDSLMVWYTDTLNGNAYMEAMSIGFGNDIDQVELSLPEYLNAISQRNYPFGHTENPQVTNTVWNLEDTRGGYPHDILHLRVQGAWADNAPSSVRPATIIRDWNAKFAWPRLISSTNSAFHADAEARIGDSLATFGGDWTDWWADGIGSGAVPLGRNRASQAGIRTGQTLNAVAQALGEPASPDFAGEVETAYEEMALFDEHTWGASNPWNQSIDKADSGEYQWFRKSGFAYTAEERVDNLVRGGIERMAVLIPKRGEGEPIAVFNPNSWERTDLARVFVPVHVMPTTAPTLIDESTGEPVPFVIEHQEHSRYRPIGQWLVFLARDVPATGYRRYHLVSSVATPGDVAADPARSSLETDEVSLTLDLECGTIASLRHVPSGHEVVDSTAPFGFNAYIHDRYATAPGFNHLSSRLHRAGPWLLGARGTGSLGIVTGRESNPVFERIRFRQTAQGASWIETTITAPYGVPRVHVANRLLKPSTMEKESVYFAFPFAGDNPAISFELPGGVAGPDSPHVPGSAQHFRAIAHWATSEAAGQPVVAWATTQAPLVQVGNILLPYAPFPESVGVSHPGTIYSWALNNIWDTNFPAHQGGEMAFDYTIAIGGDNAAGVGRDTGAAASQPLVGIYPRRYQQGVALPPSGSILTIDEARVEITHLSPGVDGTLIAWVESHATEPVTVRLESELLPIATAETTSFLGTGRESIRLDNGGASFSINPGAIIQVRLTLRR